MPPRSLGELLESPGRIMVRIALFDSDIEEVPEKSQFPVDCRSLDLQSPFPGICLYIPSGDEMQRLLAEYRSKIAETRLIPAQRPFPRLFLRYTPWPFRRRFSAPLSYGV